MPNGKGHLECCYCIYFKGINDLEGYPDANNQPGWCSKNSVKIPTIFNMRGNSRICAQFHPNKYYHECFYPIDEQDNVFKKVDRTFSRFAKPLDPKFLYTFMYNLPNLVEAYIEFSKLSGSNANSGGSTLIMKIGMENTIFEITEGNIADQDTEAVVTAASTYLKGGSGTDGVIHAIGGTSIMDECYKIGGCPTGDAVITNAGKLKAKYVIHAVGPIWEDGEHNEAKLLASAYWQALKIASEHSVRSISFPSISTGAYSYPLKLAAPIAIETIIKFIEGNSYSFSLIRLVLYPREQPSAYLIYRDALTAWCIASRQNSLGKR